MLARRSFALVAALALVLAACGDDSATTTTAGASQPAVEITLAHSYVDGQPQVDCGVNVIKSVAEGANVGLTINVFGNSELGGDADRIQSVIAGDIDMDIQGASALSAVYEPMSVVDGAFVFDDSEHMHRFFTSDASKALTDGFFQATGVRVLGAWNTGARQFTANVPIRTPDDLQGLRMRFPPSPAFLLNADAMGAEAVTVAYEELYLALQQGTVDGQENPISNIKAKAFYEVQDYISLSSHQLSSNLVIIGPVWDTLTAEQQAALQDAVDQAMIQEPQCVADFETTTLDDWRSSGAITIVDDVDRAAFRNKVEPYLRDHYNADQIAVLDAIRSTATG